MPELKHGRNKGKVPQGLWKTTVRTLGEQVQNCKSLSTTDVRAQRHPCHWALLLIQESYFFTTVCNSNSQLGIPPGAGP